MNTEILYISTEIDFTGKSIKGEQNMDQIGRLNALQASGGILKSNKVAPSNDINISFQKSAQKPFMGVDISPEARMSAFMNSAMDKLENSLPPDEFAWWKR